MRLLVTAGVTQVPIDQVRVITSTFSGRTGTRIALEANRRGYEVTLVTSAPHLVGEQLRTRAGWTVQVFRTFDDLHCLLAALVPSGQFDAIIHSAAVSDYRVADVFVPRLPSSAAGAFSNSETQLDPAMQDSQLAQSCSEVPGEMVGTTWQAWPMTLSCPKIPSTFSEIWLRLVPTPKLVDYFRSSWGFTGVLVKFKLEAGVSEDVLVQRAEESRRRSHADLMVANLLESVATTAWLGPLDGQYRRISRPQLASILLDAIEALVASAP